MAVVGRGPDAYSCKRTDGVTLFMSEARTDTTQARPREASALAAEAASSGRHRGPAAAEESGSTPHGRHRRDKQTQDA